MDFAGEARGDALRTAGRYVKIDYRRYGGCSDCRRADIVIRRKRPARCRPARKAGRGSLEGLYQLPWPYLNCVGTSLGNPHIRLLTTDRLNP